MVNKTFIAATFIFALFACNTSSTSVVYICTGPMSTAYHKTDDCKGLTYCSEEIVAVSKGKAIDMGRHPCYYCH